MKCKLFTLLIALLSLSAFGFSPYENYLLSGEQTHVALMASAKEGNVEELQAALTSLKEKKMAKGFKKVKISNVSAYSKKLQGKTWFMVYFDYDGETYLDAVKAFESIAAVRKIAPLLEPHPRAKGYGNVWLQLEWMNYIRGAKEKDRPADRIAMVTRIKPEKEQEYRLLHQAVWPGVVDQMARGNYHNFSIFFVEIGDELYEFFYVEYVGTDAAKDGEMNNADPFNQRWWKITDACQNPLPDADGVWSKMDKASE
jgi:L-rhamnose mutarotase